MKLVKPVGLVALILASATTAHARELGSPTVSFTGDFFIQFGPPQTNAHFRIFYTPRIQAVAVRRKGRLMVRIFNRATGTVTDAVPSVKVYSVRRFKADEPYPEMFFQGRKKGTLISMVGREPCGAHQCVKYRIQTRNPREFSDYFAWYTWPHNILIRIAGYKVENGRRQNISAVMRSLKIGPPDPTFFKVPSDYQNVEDIN